MNMLTNRTSVSAIKKQLSPLCGALLLALTATLQAAPVVNWSHLAPDTLVATKLVDPKRAPIMAATRAGDQIVAVGEYGTVLRMQADGSQLHQAQAVPTRAPLTAVHFIDQRHGWAVGHQGVILRTRDGGENWTRLPTEEATDALFSVWFENQQHGFAGGRFALLLETQDGGDSWQRLEFLPDPDADEVHLFDLFGDGAGRVYAASEQGQLFAYTDSDSGASWSLIETGFDGSLWGGIAASDGTLIVVGMIGAIYRSEDFGQSWQPIAVDASASFTDITRMADGSVVAVGLNGVVAVSRDNGNSFVVQQRDDRASLTGVAGGGAEHPLLFSKTGLVR